MNRDELVELRKAYIARIERMRHVGDYGAGAADIRETSEVVLQVLDHLLERMRKP
jgi:hypothetical protein